MSLIVSNSFFIALKYLLKYSYWSQKAEGKFLSKISTNLSPSMHLTSLSLCVSFSVFLKDFFASSVNFFDVKTTNLSNSLSLPSLKSMKDSPKASRICRNICETSPFVIFVFFTWIPVYILSPYSSSLQHTTSLPDSSAP